LKQRQLLKLLQKLLSKQKLWLKQKRLPNNNDG